MISALIVVVGTSLLFTFIGMQEKKILLRQVESQAKMLFRQIVLTRRWIADHGGIFIEKTAGMEANPYLAHNMITDQAGTPYVRENPALATRHLSEYAQKTGYYWFHITSLRPINPENAPDSFETTALQDFAARRHIEASTVEHQQGHSFFRYIAPLITAPPCRKCHPDYKVGEVRGALSVTLPIDSLLSQIKRNSAWLIFGAITLGLILFCSLYVLLNSFVLRPMAQLQQAMEKYPVLRAADTIKNRDEFGQLARAFDRMQDKIQEYQNTLQEKVALASADFRETSRRYQDLSLKKSDFIARISHELRTPLTAVRGAAEYILSLLGKPAAEATETCTELQRFAEIISSNTERLERMVNETLDIEKIESGRSDFHITSFAVGSAVSEVLQELDPLIHSRSLQLQTNIDTALPIINGDRDRIKDVLTNLLINAFDYSPEGGILQITCTPATNTVRIEIQDQGPGVPPQLREKVFEKFYKGRKGGTGLGLALCRSVVNAHDGRIWVESAGAYGSAFIVELPVHKKLPDSSQ